MEAAGQPAGHRGGRHRCRCPGAPVGPPPAMILLDTSIFLTNDRRARTFCAEIGVEAFDVAGLLRLIWTSRVRSKEFVRDLLQRMERIEGLVLKNKERIFRGAGGAG